MSKKKRNNKNHQTNKKPNIGLLGDNRKQKQLALIGLALSCVLAIILFCFVIPSFNNQEQPTEDEVKETINDTLSLKLAGSSLVDETQYNVWFDINSILTDSEVTFEMHDGILMKQNNETGETSLVTEAMSLEDTKLYSFVWVFEKPEEGTILSDIVVTVENKTTKKSAGFYVFCDGPTIGYLTEQQYVVLRKAEDSKPND